MSNSELKIAFSVSDRIVFEAEGTKDVVRDSFKLFIETLGKIEKMECAMSGTTIQAENKSECTPTVPFNGNKYISNPWPAVIEQIKSGVLFLSVGDIIYNTLEDSTPVEWVVTDVDNGAYRFESRDCLGWHGPHTDVNDFLNSVWERMHPNLKQFIIHTERPHIKSSGEKYSCDQLLFLPAASEIFPADKCLGDKGIYEQLEYYKDVHNRVRSDIMGGAETEWYWTDSPYSGNSSGWCRVNTGGYCSVSDASYGGIAAPVCFRIPKSL